MGAITNDWLEPLSAEFKKPYYKKLYETVKHEYETRRVFPDANDIFNAFAFTPLSQVKVVIPDVAVPPSLVNIYQELHDDLGCTIPNNGYLEKWARQGVLLLNTVLTVRAHAANSHRNMGWEEFTDAAIRILGEQDRPMVFILWGRPARMKKSMLHNPRHLILEAPHPSPFSASSGFFGSRPFSQTNRFLEANGLEPIDWQIDNV